MNNSSTSLLEHLKARTSVKWASFIILTLVTALLYNYFFLNRAHVDLEIEVKESTVLKLFWADASETKYAWTKMVKKKLRPHYKHYGFFIGDLRNIHSLRFYPTIKDVGEVVVKRITIKQPGMQEQVFETAEDFNKFVPGWDVKETRFEEGKGWVIVPSGEHPHFHLVVEPSPRVVNVPLELGHFLGILFILYIVFSIFEPLVKQYQFISWLAFTVFMFATIMAVTSLDNHHPDERVHAQAADYYSHHWLMPAVDSPEIDHTYSVYGFSRLNSKEICYFIAGKFSRLSDNFNLHSFQRYRFFNVALLGFLVLMTFKSRTSRLLLIPLLMTPQAWYIFSYYNSDAFALFINFLAAYQVVYKQSLLNRFFRGDAGGLHAALVLGPLTGALLLLKKNDYFFLVFLVLYLLLAFVVKRSDYSKNAAKKLVVIACVGLTLVTIRYGLDVKVNGFNKGEQVIAMSRKRAREKFNLNTPVEDRSPFLRIKSQGVSLEKFLDKYDWAGKISRSFYGVYGYLTVSCSTAYYKLMLNVGFLFVFFIAISVIIRGGWWENGILLNAILCSVGLVCAACYVAWAHDFQAQGRYLLPILPMLGVLLVNTEHLLQPLILRSFIIFMFVMSSYNFIFVGLRNIAKYGWG